MLMQNFFNSTISTNPERLADLLQESRPVRKYAERLVKTQLSEDLGEIIEKANHLTDAIANCLDCIEPHQPTSTNPMPFLLPAGNSCDEIRHSCSKGTHLYVQRMAYTHHGIYLGDDFVIHYDDGSVMVVELEDFADTGWIYIKNSVKTYSDARIVQRAQSRFGEAQYHLLFNNCEHFAEWCRNGD